MSQNPFGNNPYASPRGHGNSQYASAPSRKYPTFCRVMFIISLVFSSIRLLILPFAIIGMFVMGEEQELTIPIVLEVVTTALIAVIGILANSLLLARKPVGIPLAWALVLTHICSIIVSAWQVATTPNVSGPPGSPEQIGFFIGIAIVVFTRLVLLTLYCIAVSRFSTWLNDRSAIHGR